MCVCVCVCVRVCARARARMLVRRGGVRSCVSVYVCVYVCVSACPQIGAFPCSLMILPWFNFEKGSTYERDLKCIFCLWQNLIVLTWPCIVVGTLNSNHWVANLFDDLGLNALRRRAGLLGRNELFSVPCNLLIHYVFFMFSFLSSCNNDQLNKFVGWEIVLWFYIYQLAACQTLSVILLVISFVFRFLLLLFYCFWYQTLTPVLSGQELDH